MIQIKDIQGNVKLDFAPNYGSLVKRELMSEHYASLKYNLSTPIDLALGDWVYLDRALFPVGVGGLFEITKKQFPKFNTSTGGYEYEFRFDAYYLKWGNKILFYDRQFAGESTWSLTRTPDAHLSIVCSNLANLGYTFNGQPITFSIDESVDMSAKLVQYDGTNTIDALTLIAETWDCEWWVEDNVIHLGRCEYNTAVDLVLGDNVQNMTRQESQDNYGTRIYAFGSERNLTPDYRSDDSADIVFGVASKRLRLPAGIDYVDAEENQSTEESVDSVVVFDDVYPRLTNGISDITTKEYTDTDESTGEVKKWNAYRFKIPGLTFSKNYVLENTELRGVFASGLLNGMDFALSFNPDAKTPEEQVFEIIRSEDYGIPLPNDTLMPSVGDRLILHGFNISMVGDQYVPAAEQELLERAKSYVEKSKIDPSLFSVEMNAVQVLKGGRIENGTEYPDLRMEIGDRVSLVNRGFFKNGRQSRIRGYEKYLDGSKVTYSVGNTAAYSRLKEVEGEVKEIVYQGNVYSSSGGSSVYVIGVNDRTTPSDRNVLSSLRALYELKQRALSRLNDDTAAGFITLLKGIILGEYGDKIIVDEANGKAVAQLSTISATILKSKEFTSGALGSGFTLRQDETGRSYLEIDELFVRKAAHFIELVIDKLSHAGGQIILTPTRTKCTRVEESSTYYRCYFESTDGEREITNDFVQGDQARYQTFNVKTGNAYYWRLVVSVGSDYIDLSKSDCDTGSTPPQEGDEIVQLGNRTNPSRQNAIILSSYGPDAPSITQYAGINSYALVGKEVTKISPSGNSFVGDFKLKTGENIAAELANNKAATEEAISRIEETQDFISALSIDLEEVKRQADGAIETWFYDPVPTLSNAPASSWTTNEQKNVHLGDLYYSKEGKAYRFRLSGGVYSWEILTDTDLTKALANAQKAQDTADGKRRVFVIQPTTDSVYDIGDLWVNATSGEYTNELLRCKTAKASGTAFNINHWEKASKYTDDTKATEAVNAAAAAQGVADAANASLQMWGDDGYISPTEKQALKNEQATIRAERTEITADASKYGISSTVFVEAFTAYDADLTYYTREVPENIEILSSFSLRQKTYYDARTALLNNIATAVKTYIQNTAIEKAGTVKTELQTQIDAVPGKITQAVSEVKTYTDSAVDNVQIGGRNLIAKKHIREFNLVDSGIVREGNDYDGDYLSVNQGVVYSLLSGGALGKDIFGGKILYKEGTQYALKVRWKIANIQNGSGLYLTFKYSDGTGQSVILPGTQTSITEASLVSAVGKTVVAIAGSYGANVQRSLIYDIQLTEGNKQTGGWLVAPEDVDAAIVAADNKAAQAQTAATNAQTSANAANTLLSDIASDNKLTANEKQETKKEWDTIVSEYSKNIAQASAFGLTYAAYTTSYNALNTYITPLLANLTTTTDIVGTTFRTTFKTYYDARTDLLNTISAKAKSLADAAQGTATNAQTRVTTAETNITQLSEQISLKATQSDVTALTNRVNAAELKITPEAINLTVTSQIENKVDAVQVGGRNYIQGSQFSVYPPKFGTTNISASLDASTKYLGYNSLKIVQTAAPDTNLTTNRVYFDALKICNPASFSMWVKASVATNFKIRIGGNGLVNTIPISTDWKVVKVEGVTNSNSIAVVFAVDTLGATFNIALPMLVEGTKATDWAPAPEDVDAAIALRPTTEAITASFNIDTEGVSIMGKKIALTGKVTFSSLASDAQGKIASAQSTAEAAQSAAGSIITSLNNLESSLGFMAYQNMVGKALLDSTIIEGGYLKTSLINVDTLITGQLLASKIEATEISTGKLTVLNGAQIGGLKVSNGSLTNEGFNNDIYILLKNDSYGTFAGIGGNLLPASSGLRAVARFENHNNNVLGANYAMIVSAKNSNTNVAILMQSGCISGFAVRCRQISAGTTLTNDDSIITCYNSATITVYLPANPEIGKEIKLIQVNAASINVYGNGKSIMRSGSIRNPDSLSSRGETGVYVYDGQYWHNGWLNH